MDKKNNRKNKINSVKDIVNNKGLINFGDYCINFNKCLIINYQDFVEICQSNGKIVALTNDAINFKDEKYTIDLKNGNNSLLKIIKEFIQNESYKRMYSIEESDSSNDDRKFPKYLKDINNFVDINDNSKINGSKLKTYDLFISARTNDKNNKESIEYRVGERIARFFNSKGIRTFWWKDCDTYYKSINEKIAVSLALSKNFVGLSFSNNIDCLKRDEKLNFFSYEVKTFRNLHDISNFDEDESFLKNTNYGKCEFVPKERKMLFFIRKKYKIDYADTYLNDITEIEEISKVSKENQLCYNVIYSIVEKFKLENKSEILNEARKKFLPNKNRKNIFAVFAKGIKKVFTFPVLKLLNCFKRKKKNYDTGYRYKGSRKNIFVRSFSMIKKIVLSPFKGLKKLYNWLETKDIHIHIISLFIIFILFLIGLFAVIFWDGFEWYWHFYYELYSLVNYEFLTGLIICLPFIIPVIVIFINLFWKDYEKLFWGSFITGASVLSLLLFGMIFLLIHSYGNYSYHIKYGDTVLLGRYEIYSKYNVKKIVYKNENIIHLPIVIENNDYNYIFYYEKGCLDDYKSLNSGFSVIFDKNDNRFEFDSEMFEDIYNINYLEFPNNLHTTNSRLNLSKSNIKEVSFPLLSQYDLNKFEYVETININGGVINKNSFSNISEKAKNICIFSDIDIDSSAFDVLKDKNVYLSNKNYEKVKESINNELLFDNNVILSCYDIDENRNRIEQDYYVTFINNEGTEIINKYKYNDEIKSSVENIDGKLYNVLYYLNDKKFDTFKVTRNIKLKRLYVPIDGYDLNVSKDESIIIESNKTYKPGEKVMLKALYVPKGYIGKWEYDGNIQYGNDCSFEMPPNDVNLVFSYALYQEDDENCIYMGTYPQTLVYDDSLIKKLNAMAESTKYNKTWVNYNKAKPNSFVSYDYMQYIDIDIDDDGVNDYRGVKIEEYRSNKGEYTSDTFYSYQDDNNYTKSSISNHQIYWFKYEPIKWEILSIDNDITFMVSNLILDNQYYYNSVTSGSFTHNGGTGNASNYELSDIKIWLDSFSNDISLINSHNDMIQSVNSGNSFKMLYESDVETYLANKNFRIKFGTDYAKCMGLEVDKSGAGNYWINYLSNYGVYAYYINQIGEKTYRYVDYCLGIVPVLRINLKANNTYTVTWKNDNGEVLEVDENVKYGTTPTYNGQVPTKESTNQFSYTFDGWDKNIVKVTNDVIYVAKYKEIEIS